MRPHDDAPGLAGMIGITPVRPVEPLFNQETAQPLYEIGTQDWHDDKWVRERFNHFRFYGRLNDGAVLIRTRPESVDQGAENQAWVMTLSVAQSCEETPAPPRIVTVMADDSIRLSEGLG